MTTADPRVSDQHLPDLDRMSVLTAVILLAYATERIFALPVWKFEILLMGTQFDYQVDIQLIVGVLLAGLVITGANWLFHDHPEQEGRVMWAHVLLPVLAASMIGFMLSQLPFNLIWWLGLLVGVTLMVVVLVAEYISIGQHDSRQPFAVAVLTGVEFVIYIAIITFTRSGQVRLYMLLPVIFLATLGVSLRNHHLRLHGEWLIFESLLIAFLVSQVAMGLHYWPLSPTAYGLLLLGATYALNSFFVSLIEGKPVSQSIGEPLISLVISVTAAVLV